MIGNTISHYKILEKLGEGGMGIVYKAQDTKLDRLVALKFLPSHLSASEDDKARFIQEAKAASALNHPNVCTIHDIQHHDGQMFIVMEFVDGQTLRYEAKSRTISLKSAIDIGIQIADALAAGFLCNADGVRPLGERSRNIGEQRRRARPQIGRMECGRSRKRCVLLQTAGPPNRWRASGRFHPNAQAYVAQVTFGAIDQKQAPGSDISAVFSSRAKAPDTSRQQTALTADLNALQQFENQVLKRK